jgi:hypothetical protein
MSNVSKVGSGKARKFVGEGMTEYIIIAALMALAAIGLYGFFGQTVRQQTAGVIQEIPSQTAADEMRGAQGPYHGRFRWHGRDQESGRLRDPADEVVPAHAFLGSLVRRIGERAAPCGTGRMNL